jgi:CDP-alcohol phosphatidyltransferase
MAAPGNRLPLCDAGDVAAGPPGRDLAGRQLRGRELRSGERRWAAVHGGLTPSAPVRLWLRGVQRLAAVGPIARIPPDLLSVAGVACAAAALAAALAAAAQGGRWALLAAALVLLVGVLDGLDGAVAVHTGRARPLGAVVDAVADRLGDLMLAATLAALGAPLSCCTSTCGPGPGQPA